jgi:hypothetical protein
MPDKSTFEQLGREAEKLRKNAPGLRKQAALLIEKSGEPERRIAARDKTKKS